MNLTSKAFTKMCVYVLMYICICVCKAGWRNTVLSSDYQFLVCKYVRTYVCIHVPISRLLELS